MGLSTLANTVQGGALDEKQYNQYMVLIDTLDSNEQYSLFTSLEDTVKEKVFTHPYADPLTQQKVKNLKILLKEKANETIKSYGSKKIQNDFMKASKILNY